MIVRAVAVAAFLATAASGSAVTTDLGALRLDVPVIRQSPERCGPAALAMVLRFHGAEPQTIEQVESAYDPVLRGALITELAAAARRAGFAAQVETPAEDSLVGLLREGTPPILLYQRGIGPIGRGHYGVLVGWDPARHVYVVNDGGAHPRSMRQDDLMRRWRSAGSQALVVRAAVP